MQLTDGRRAVAAVAAALTTLTLGSVASAQTNQIPSMDVPLTLDSGWVYNNGHQKQVIAAFTAHSPGARWMQLDFDVLTLSGNPMTGSGSSLMITSTKDGYYQILNATSAAQWGNKSAYFNGDTVVVELIAAPGSGPNRIAVDRATIGLDPVEDTICGNDDRVLSNKPFAARALPIGCTAWIFDDVEGCFGTAGHCMSGSSTIQFNVPLSNANGSINNPPPQHQYATDNASRQWVNGGQGNDWAYFGVFPNSNTGLTPRQAQGGSYTLSLPPPFNGNDTIDITGYGVDSSPSSWNQVQQTNSGPWVSSRGMLRYETDTQGGNSGSPVVHEQTGNVIGVHTHGGCSFSGGSNVGTSHNNGGWLAALASPQGLCVPACPLPSVTFFNGGGTNPALLSSVSPPVAGGVWQISIDTSAYPGATSTAVRLKSRPFSGIFFPGGEVLQGEGPVLQVSNLPATGGVDVHTFTMSAATAGLPFVAQGAILDPAGNVLTNAEVAISGCP